MFAFIRQWWVRCLIRRARQCFDAGNWAQAAEHAAEAAEADESNISARMLLGLACMKHDDLTAAAEWFAAVLAIEPDHLDAKTHLAMTYARSKQWDKAMAVVESLAAEQPSRAGQVVCEQPAKAEPAPTPAPAPAAGRTPDLPRPAVKPNRSVAEIVKAQDWPALKEAAEAALAANPGNGSALLQLGMALYRMGRGDEALTAYDDALDVSKESEKTVVNYNRAMVLMQLGRWGEACRTFESLAMLPADARGKIREEPILYSLGYCYMQRKMFKMAQSVYERLDRLAPDYRDVSYCLKTLRVPLASKAAAPESAGAICGSCSQLLPMGASFCTRCGWRADAEDEIAITVESE